MLIQIQETSRWLFFVFITVDTHKMNGLKRNWYMFYIEINESILKCSLEEWISLNQHTTLLIFIAEVKFRNRS